MTRTIHTDERFPRHQALALIIAERLPRHELAHDHLHIERVYGWALRLAPELAADVDLAGAAALVHDCVTIAKDSAERPLGGERSAQLAAGLLPEAGYDAAACEAVIEAVRTCSWSRGLSPQSPLAQVLQDADRLDALGVSGLLRAATCAQDMAPRTDGSLYDRADPLPFAQRELDDRRAMLDHLACKLLLLAAGMHSPSARMEAQRRHATLLALRWELLRENAGIHPPAPSPLQATGLLLDFDGTLVDSAAPIVASLRHAGQQVGLHFGDDDAPLRALIGRPLADSMATWGLDADAVSRAIAAYREAWFGGERDRCQLFPGVIETLTLLRQRGIRLVLASAKAQRGLEDAVARIGLGDLLDACCGAEVGEHDKLPVVRRAQAACAAANPAMVGDRCFDGEAAQAAAMPFIAVSYGYGSMAELADCQPARWIGHPTDLIQHCALSCVPSA